MDNTEALLALKEFIWNVHEWDIVAEGEVEEALDALAQLNGAVKMLESTAPSWSTPGPGGIWDGPTSSSS